MRNIKKVEIRKNQVFVDANIVYSQVKDVGLPISHLLHMSLMRPLLVSKKRLPVIVWLEGGAWRQLDHNWRLHCLAPYAEHGYVVASVQYRTSGQAAFPAQIEDVKSAIRYLRANADRLGIDPERIGVVGHSAGGHLAAMLGATGDDHSFDTMEWTGYSSCVQAVVDLFGPIDLFEFSRRRNYSEEVSPYSPESLLLGKNIVKHKDVADQANPISYLTPNASPYLILHGDQDPIIPLYQSELLYEALIEKGVEAHLFTIEGAGHGTPEFEQEETVRVVLDFLDRHLLR